VPVVCDVSVGLCAAGLVVEEEHPKYRHGIRGAGAGGSVLAEELVSAEDPRLGSLNLTPCVVEQLEHL
jgi:hypothetical protein